MWVLCTLVLLSSCQCLNPFPMSGDTHRFCLGGGGRFWEAGRNLFSQDACSWGEAHTEVKPIRRSHLGLWVGNSACEVPPALEMAAASQPGVGSLVLTGRGGIVTRVTRPCSQLCTSTQTPSVPPASSCLHSHFLPASSLLRLLIRIGWVVLATTN